jgi:hypothetical protein
MLKRIGVLLTAALIATAVCFVWTQSSRGFYPKTVVLEMSWKRGDGRYGPNFIRLESPCLSNPEPGCYCSVDFTVTTSKEFADYVESFGSKKIQVKYDVSYDHDRQVTGAVLNSVGVWPAERFNIVERSLASGFHGVQNQSGSRVLRGNAPSDCFAKFNK